MPTPGKKNQKGQSEKYDEMKKRVNFTLTPTGLRQLENLAVQRQLSKSEFIEQIARGEITLQSDPLTSLEREIIKKCFGMSLHMPPMSLKEKAYLSTIKLWEIAGLTCNSR